VEVETGGGGGAPSARHETWRMRSASASTIWHPRLRAQLPFLTLTISPRGTSWTTSSSSFLTTVGLLLEPGGHKARTGDYE
jgi:hypothetical protein